jgi:methylenetetrahydrofolate dehydrogenase (NADP+) / methenyltetrahydrofolate cyclohydrolase
MTAERLDGSALSKSIKAGLKQEIVDFSARTGVIPALSVLRVGDDEASASYARAIGKNCASVGVGFDELVLGEDVSQAEVEAALQSLNENRAVHGVMILEPLPDTIDADSLVLQLHPDKDVDGVHPMNAGRLQSQRPPYFVPATPEGGIRLLEEAGVSFRGKSAVMVGRSDIVGKPMAMLLLHRHCTVTIAHSRTQDLPGVCRSADILCLAVGRPEMVKGDWVKPGAIVVDFGTNYTDSGLKGDCDQAEVVEIASMITPVPGGTGPMTNAMLMSNVLKAARLVTGETQAT